MEIKRSLKTKQKMQLSALKTILIATTSVSIVAIIAFMIFFYNVGNVRFAFAAGHNFTSKKDGNWNDPSIWKGGSVPGDGDNVTIYNDIEVPSNINVSLNQMIIYNARLEITGNSNITVNSGLISYGYYYDSSVIELQDSSSLTTSYYLYNYGLVYGSSVLRMKDNSTYYCGNQINNYNYYNGNIILDCKGNSEIVFNGNSTQNIPNDNEGTLHLNNITINNSKSSSPQVQLTGTTTIYGTLKFLDGTLKTTSSNMLQFGDGGSIDGFNASEYIDGPYRKVGSGNFTFYVMDGDHVSKIGISDLTASSTFEASYTRSEAPDNSSLNDDLERVSSMEYWTLTRVSGSGSARVTLYWYDPDSSGVVDTSDLYVAKFDENTNEWISYGRYTSGGSLAAGEEGYITSELISQFSPFTFGSGQGINPLPVELMAFNAKPLNDIVELTWVTASEKNNDRFEIQRSTDGEEFETIGQVNGAGNSLAQLNYEYTDGMPVGNLIYYRLNQIDFDGKSELSDIKVVHRDGGENDNSVVINNVGPNPFNQGFKINISSTTQKNVTVTIINTTGQTMYEEPFSLNPGTNVFEYPYGYMLKEGVYILSLAGEGLNESQKIIKKNF